MKFVLALVFSTALCTSAIAQFQEWSSTVENNPFTRGTDVALLHIISIRTQVQIRCDSSKQGINLVAIPGFEYTDDLAFRFPVVKLVVDGNIILDKLVGTIDAFGANLAGVSVDLDREEAEKLTSAFVTAKKQIAIEDGMSTAPYLMSARGSTAAAKELRECYEAQKVDEPASDESAETASVDEKSNDAIKAEIAELEAKITALKEQMKASNR